MTDNLITVRESEVIVLGDAVTFVPLYETNEWEGEAWVWWVQLTGNEDALARLAELITEAMGDNREPPFKLDLDSAEPTFVVDKLVAYAAEGYHAAHNKVTGTLTVPDSLGEDADVLYKGGIQGLYKAD